MAHENTLGKIVVTTPTGNVGSRVVRLLLQAGMRPTLLLRDPDRIDAHTRARVDLVQGDQGDVDAVLRATRGADRLFWVDPPTPDDDPVAGHARMGANAARAVSENGIGHTVFLSSVGAEKRHGAGEIDGLARTEQALDATGANVLHLRCGYFFTNLFMDISALREGVLPTPWPLESAMPWVDPRDIGDVAAARLLSANWSGSRVQAVHGPEDLSFSGVADILAQALGRPVRAERVSDEEVRAGLGSVGLSTGQIEGVVGMAAGLREGFTPEQERGALTTTPTTLAAWAHAHLRPALST
ncbi:NmrA family NAD(P)-binding protein [Nocardiopsis kunsanensis]|uniref:NmrA family transcriptional regulator n=1 Tax=Nocardiopsis kunsanensis TaxID=141693 RepID=A0A919CH65_9ACTN|nr:NAD(P)H-binding protein [Nocardiopsis kunsanensis]GHD20661.1 NmrA family transcriptional regulator [Nocardiopsis kunsanensis]